MAYVFKNQSIVVRLAILCLIPLLALMLVSGLKIKNEYMRAQESSFVKGVFDKAPVISGLVHELQRERGRSAGFLASKGVKFHKELTDRRIATDKAIEAFRNSVREPTGRFAIDAYKIPYDAAIDSLKKLQAMRSRVDRVDLTPKEMAQFYTPMIRSMIAMIESISKIINDGDTLRNAFGYVALIEGKERAGVERAIGATGLNAGAFEEATYQSFIGLAAKQDTYFTIFHQYSTPEERAFFAETISGQVQANVESYRGDIRKSAFGGDLDGLEAGEWFKFSTERIDALKLVEDHIADSIVSEIEKAYSKAQWGLWSTVGLLVALVIVTTYVSFLVYRSIAPPIMRLVRTMMRLASNDTSVKVEDTDRQDEIGKMARSVEIFRENTEERLVLEGKAGVERDKERHRQVHIEEIITEFRGVVGERLSMVGEQTGNMDATSMRLQGVAQSASSQAQSASSATAAASQDVQVVASAAEELSASIKEIEHQTGRANEAMTAASERALATDKDVSQLAEAADQIGDVLNLIRDIAERTNLLALNATIEAARAGEAGRGFAIVAQEVKSLSNQTAQATEEISGQISGIQNSTTHAVSSIRGIIESVEEVRQLTDGVSSAVSQQREATQEIANSVLSASNGTDSVSENVALVSDSIQQTSGEAHAVNDAAESLKTTTDMLKGEIETFLQKVAQDVNERRAALRIKMKEIVLISGNGRHLNTNIINCSTTGAALEPIEGVEIGDEFDVQLPNNITVNAKVVRRQEQLVGIQFKEPLESIDDLLLAQDAA
ncbi:MAG: nitrate- and nitrite sensing domain-containing protein [Pseudomonadota bacterium]